MLSPLSLNVADQQRLEEWVAAFGTPQQVALRSQIALAAAGGEADSEIAQQLGINRKTVMIWRARVADEGPDSVWDIAPGRGRKPKFGPDRIEAIVAATLQTKPVGMTHWSCRTMAASQHVGKSTIQTIWQSHNLRPHRVKRFKLSRDPKFLEKLTDVVGLYLNPPDKAILLCVDEKAQIQALDRTQPGLPLKKGRCGTMTQFPGDVPLHMVLDNYGTHKHPRVRTWLARHPRFVLHFVPTSSSWLNLVERWFSELTSKRIRRGSFGSVEELQAAIDDFLTTWNKNPKPFVWTATVESIVEKLSRCRQTLERIAPGSTRSRARKTTK